ncbi:inorganic phosphate transporter [Athalassotoga saccharophila]|uniref:inorganic phosphate transporter n=1 Tax=Athalassotoga saccharophila TaxID=1441386 RepID=UPI00137AEC62|nr:inorganic phosphate transporter [Athalassotoga saccharophila]BBJ27691.1 sulfate permease CysP [Athalassotoga saccharophila]
MLRDLLMIATAMLLGWSLGYNNMATIFGPLITSDIIKYRVATITGAIFIFLGAFLGGDSGISTMNSVTHVTFDISVSAALSTAIVVLIMTHYSLPTSITQGIIGSLVGVGLVERDVNWWIVGKVAISWLITPFGALVIAVFSYIVISLFYNRLKSLRLRGTVVRLMSFGFSIYASYSLGANNLANITGPFVGKGLFGREEALLIGGIAMALGFLTASKKVIRTIGKDITIMEPFDSSIAIFGEGTSLLIFSFLGIPISSAQASVGSTAGVGIVNGIKTVSLKTILRIVSGWLVTPFITGTIAVIIYMVMKIWG